MHDPAGPAPVHVENPDGAGPYVLCADHATCAVPAPLGGLGLPDEVLAGHIAWDPGALAVARVLARRIDAPLVHPAASRLVIDVNRDPSAPDSIVAASDGVAIPGNAALDAQERTRRVERHYRPFHEALERAIGSRLGAGTRPALVSIHTFTPVLGGRERPWDVGVIHDRAHALADALVADLSAEPGLVVGRNEPYAPSDGVYHTLSLHADARGLECAMIEIRADRVAGAAEQARWAGRLAGALERFAAP